MNTALRQRQQLAQRQTLAPQMRQSLRLLEMDIGDLRAELYREMAENPVFEDLEQSLDGHTTGEVERASDARERADASDWPEDDDDAEASYYAADADALERRQKFFDSRTRPETLEEHLRAQLGMTDLNATDRALAETLIGYLDADGRFTGSFADLVMVTGASERRLRGLLRVIMTLDPPGCGATTLEECLIAQTDRVAAPFREEVRELIARHLRDLAAHDYAKVEAALGLSRERLEDDLATLRTLEPHPGRAFAPATADEAYIRPEVHAVRDGSRWVARVDERDLPTIRVSKRYERLLASPETDAETRDYIKAKLAAVEAIREAIDRRYDTIRAIAQAIFDAQPGFFREGMRGLRPLTMNDVAERVGVHHTTVSRTVNGKYASTPFGTVELRAFFIAGIANADGEEVARGEAFDRLRAFVEAEDKANPLSDERLAAQMKAAGLPVARRTVAKYRGLLGIPGAAARRVAPPSAPPPQPPNG